MDRRSFVKLTTAALITEQFLSINNARSQPNSANSPVVWEVEGITTESINELFLKLGGITKFLPGDVSKATVLVKPNLCLPHPAKSATTTSPMTIDVLCRVLTGFGVKRIVIADHTLQKTTDFQNIELHEVLKSHPEASLILANEERWYLPVELNGKVLKSTSILKFIPKADLFINLATAKHHTATHVSLCIKNLMGAIWNRSDFHTKFDLQQACGDLPLAVKPHINIIDASRVLLNGGPTGPGQVINENRLFAGLDIVATDSVVVSRYNFGGKGFKSQEVAHLNAAYNNGLGEIDINKILVKKI